MLCALPCLAPVISRAQSGSASSAEYSITPSSADSAGLSASSADYSADFSTTAGAAAESAAYRIRSGWSGQLSDIAGLQLSAPSNSVPETSSTQITAAFRLDDGTFAPLTAAETASLGWSVLEGPIASLNASGFLTTAAVYENTPATIEASHGLTDTNASLELTITDTIPDNYPGYAGDGLSDAWQVRYFTPTPNGQPTGQNGDYDHDGVSNFLEYAFGTDPANATSGSGKLTYANGVLTSRGQPAPLIANIPNSVDFRVIFSRRRDYVAGKLLYRIQFSADLRSWSTTTATPSVIARDAEYEAASVPWPLFVNGRKARFFRVSVSVTP